MATDPKHTFGFDFLQELVKNAGSALPAVGQWVAPTLDPQEIEKRIEELRTVQFWLEQNARMLGATIQALEVQRMTLSTLKSMNVPMGDLRESLKIPMPAAARPAQASQDTVANTSAVDPMQWWTELTTQFTQLAAAAMKDTRADVAKARSSTRVEQSAHVPERKSKKVVPATDDAARKTAVARRKTRA